MFCAYRMLDNRPSKPLVWSSWMHLHLMLDLLCLVILDGCGTHLVEPTLRTVPPRFCSRCQVNNDSSIRSGVLSSYNSWGSGYDVANVDGFRDHAWIYCFRCLHGCDAPLNPRFQLEIDAWFNRHSVSLHMPTFCTYTSGANSDESLLRMHAGVFLSRVT